MSDPTETPEYRENLAQIAEALMESTARNCPGWSPMDCPSEIVVDLVNERDELKAELDQLRLDFDKACSRVTELETALRPFANARTKEGWFGSIPDSQAYVAARLALGLPWEPRIPHPATISMEDTLAWLEKRQGICTAKAEEAPRAADHIEYVKAAKRYEHHANHVRALRETVQREYDRHTLDAKAAGFEQCGCTFCIGASAAISPTPK